MTKRDAASEQIDQAIRSFFDDRLATAVTLAGAAEGVLPEPANPGVALFHLMREKGALRPGPPQWSEKEVADLLNKARNWLKHQDADRSEVHLKEEHAVTMILRAHTKFTSAFGADAATETMLQFEAWFRQNYSHWLDPGSE